MARAATPPEQPVAGEQGQVAPFDDDSTLLFDPDIGGVVNTALRDEWPADQVAAALQQTNAFQEIMARRQQLADPAAGPAAKLDLRLKVAGMLGRNPQDLVVADYVGLLESGRATFAALNALADPFEVGTPASRVQELAALHGIPLSEDQAGEYVGMQEPDLMQQFGQWSQELHPWKPPGMTHMQAAGIFANVYNAELERNAAPDDPHLQALIEQSQGNLGIFKQLVRGSEGWDETSRGRELVSQREQQVVRDLLYGQAAGESMQTNQQAYQIQEAVGAQAASQPMFQTSASGGGGGGGGGSYGGGGGSASYAGLSAAESWIIQRESGNRPTADNPTSTAFGLGQLLYSNRVAYGRKLGFSPTTTDYAQQLAMFRAYVKDRYGTAENARAFWQAHGWY